MPGLVSTYVARGILAGAPGLGKSHLAPALARFLNCAEDVWSGAPTAVYLHCIAAHDLQSNHGHQIQQGIYDSLERCKAEFEARPLPAGRYPLLVILVEEITRARGAQAMHHALRDLLGSKGFEYKTGTRGRTKSVRVCLPNHWSMVFLATTNAGCDEETARADARRLGTNPTEHEYKTCP